MATPRRRIATITTAGSPGGSSKALSTARAVQITDDAVRDPARLSRILSDVQTAQNEAARSSNSNPLASPCIVRGQAVTNGATVTVRHTLQRNLTGWWVIRAHGAAASFKELLPGDGGYPSGLDLSKALVVVAGSTGTFDFAIVGD